MADMANDDKPDTVDTEASAEPKEPKARSTASEKPPVGKASATAQQVAPDKVGTDGDAEPVPPQPTLAAQHAAEDHADHGLAHTMPIWMLVAVLGALMLLTIVTVSVTSYDLGSEGNLVVGMVIATIKAGLVVTFFMHLLWDKKFHLILFLTAVLFVVLFLSMSITDRGEYQQNIDLYQNTTAAAPAAAPAK
jgi:cytochrome c oxidase subunit IV